MSNSLEVRVKLSNNRLHLTILKTGEKNYEEMDDKKLSLLVEQRRQADKNVNEKRRKADQNNY